MARFTRMTAVLSLGLLTACGDTPPEDTASMTDDMEAPSTLQVLIELPADFAPEGIAIGPNNTFYAGSLAPPNVGQILAGDLATGEYAELVPASGTPALGIKHDERSNLLYVAGGGSGGGKVYDAATGVEVASFSFAAAPSTINDVIVTGTAAYFTDSQLPALYRVAIGADGRPGETTTLELPANWNVAGTTCEGAPPIKGNGIAATPDGRYLILVHMSEGALYRMDTTSNAVERIALTGGDACSADGLLLDGSTLYFVQNFLNRIGVAEMSANFLSGTVTRHITEPFASNPATKVPTTIADAGDALYAVTAGFAEPSPDYVVRVEK